MFELNISAVFRRKIDDGIFNFDVVVVHPVSLVSSLVGYCIVNTKTNSYYVTVNKCVAISKEDTKELGKKF